MASRPGGSIYSLALSGGITPIKDIGSILGQARDRAGQSVRRRVDLAVTGLSQAGKTVFITSLVRNLTCLRDGSTHLPAFRPAAEGRIRGVAERYAVAADFPRFPTADNLRAMGAEARHWPAPTAALSRTELLIRYDRRRGSLGRLGLPGILDLVITDFPGEWLLDLGLLGQDYAAWSRQTLALLRQPPRADHAREFLAFLSGLDPTAPPTAEADRRGHDLYVRLLQTLRDAEGLRFLQPGRFVMPDGKGDRPILWFFPLEPRSGEAAKAGSLWAHLEARYRAYGAELVQPFFREILGRTNRQVVLVDLLGALYAGRAVFEDTCRALEAIRQGLQLKKAGRGGWFTPRRFDRVLFAATKADHVPELHRDRLTDLLTALTGIDAGALRAGGAREKSLALAAVRCTEEGRVQLEIGEVDVVIGVPVGGTNRVKVYPGTIPREPPPPEFWDTRSTRFPRFAPPPIAADAAVPIAHINLDVALQFLLGDLLL